MIDDRATKGMVSHDPFAPDYETARERFRSLAAERGWRLEALPVDLPGSRAGELTIDLAELGSDQASHLLIASSGLHGLEALFGSAVQIAWMQSLPRTWEPPAGWRVLLLHILNPWGAAHLRRCDEENIDLNRNFLPAERFEQLRSESRHSMYKSLDPYLNPPTPGGRLDFFPLVAASLIVRFGMRALRQCLPVGQYAFPQGLFFGGHGPARTTRLIMENAPRWLGPAQKVIHLDFHTGLGKWGGYRLLTVEPPDSPRLAQVEQQFGAGRAEPHGGPTAYPSRGDMGEWLQERFADRDYLFLTAEFGTHGPITVIGSLRAENRAHHWAGPSSQVYSRAKERARQTFVPQSPGWRNLVLPAALHLFDQALQPVTGSSSG